MTDDYRPCVTDEGIRRLEGVAPRSRSGGERTEQLRYFLQAYVLRGFVRYDVNLRGSV